MTPDEQDAMRAYLLTVLKVSPDIIEPIMLYLAPLSHDEAAYAVQSELDKYKPIK